MAEKWIQNAIKHPGALRATAKKAGAMTKKGTIQRGFIEEKAKGGGKTGQRARLAMTLSNLAKKAVMKAGKKRA